MESTIFTITLTPNGRQIEGIEESLESVIDGFSNKLDEFIENNRIVYPEFNIAVQQNTDQSTLNKIGVS